MGSHIMKTTIEIADDLFERVQRVARKENTTFRSLTEQGLRIVLKEKQAKLRQMEMEARHMSRRRVLTEEFQECAVGKNPRRNLPRPRP